MSLTRRLKIALAGNVAIATSFLIGCAPNANGLMRPTLPWTRNVPATAPQNANPWGAAPPADGLSATSPRLPRLRDNPRLGFFNDLMKRADQQELLAQRQRKELERLTLEQQDRQDKERSYVIAQREKERAELLKQYEDKERLLAQREEKYKGQYDQLRGSASSLDANNRDLHAQLARTESEREVLRDEIDLLKRRLADTTNQLSRTKQVSTETGKRLQALQASASTQRGNASIRANSSVSKPVTAAMVPGMDIRQDGDVVRIAIPSEKLFIEGTATLHQGSQPYMDQIAQVLQRYYPQQIAGVEAHSDQNAPGMGGSQWRNHHQLTAAQSMAIFEQLTSRNITPQQLFVSGHGDNYPLVSGGTSQGQAINRRVEIVVYPETFSR